MNSLICQAINEKRLLDFRYDGHHRVIEPHAYGVNDKGHQILRCYQVGGSSESHKSPYWRIFLVSDIHGLQILSQSFAGARTGYKRNDSAMIRIYAQL
jgi:hypothetical protein